LFQPVWSQTFTGTISGVVTDPNSARIPHTTVHVRNEANGEVRQANSGNEGLYVFSQLPPGSYEISAEAQGFRKAVETGVILRVNQTVEVNISLQLGDVTQVVEVSGGVTLLDTRRLQPGSSIFSWAPAAGVRISRSDLPAFRRTDCAGRACA